MELATQLSAYSTGREPDDDAEKDCEVGPNAVAEVLNPVGETLGGGQACSVDPYDTEIDCKVDDDAQALPTIAEEPAAGKNVDPIFAGSFGNDLRSLQACCAACLVSAAYRNTWPGTNLSISTSSFKS